MRPGSSGAVRREVDAGGTDLDAISTYDSFSQSGVRETGLCHQVNLESLYPFMGPPRHWHSKASEKSCRKEACSISTAPTELDYLCLTAPLTVRRSHSGNTDKGLAEVGSGRIQLRRRPSSRRRGSQRQSDEGPWREGQG